MSSLHLMPRRSHFLRNDIEKHNKQECVKWPKQNKGKGKGVYILWVANDDLFVRPLTVAGVTKARRY